MQQNNANNVKMIYSNSQQILLNDKQFQNDQGDFFQQVNNRPPLLIDSFNKQLICSYHKLPIEYIVLCTNYSYHYQNCCRKCLHQYKSNNQLCSGYCNSCQYCQQTLQTNQINTEQQQFRILFEIDEVLIDYTISFKKLIKAFEKALRLIKMVILKLNYNSLKRDSMLCLQKLYNNLKNISIEHMTLMGIDVKQFQKDLESNSSEHSYQRNAISFESIHRCMNFLLNEQKQWEEQERTIERFITNQFDGYQNKRKKHLSEETYEYNEDQVQSIDFPDQNEDNNVQDCYNNQNRQITKKNVQKESQYVSNVIQQNQTQSIIQYNNQIIGKQDQTLEIQENISNQQVLNKQNSQKSFEQKKESNQQNQTYPSTRNVEEVLISQSTFDTQTNKYNNPLLYDYSFNDIFNINFLQFFNQNPQNWNKKYQQLEDFNSKETDLIHDLHNQIKFLFLERFDRVKYSLISQNKSQMIQNERNNTLCLKQSDLLPIFNDEKKLNQNQDNLFPLSSVQTSQNYNSFDYNESTILETPFLNINCQKADQTFFNSSSFSQTAKILSKESENTFLFQEQNNKESNQSNDQENLIQKVQQDDIYQNNSYEKQELQHHYSEQLNVIQSASISNQNNQVIQGNQEFDQSQDSYVQQQNKTEFNSFKIKESEQRNLQNDEVQIQEQFTQDNRIDLQDEFNEKNILSSSVQNNNFDQIENNAFINNQIDDISYQQLSQQNIDSNDDDDYDNIEQSQTSLTEYSSQKVKEKFNLENLQCKDIDDVELVHHGKFFKFANVSYFDFNERYGIFYSMTEICQMYLFDFEQKRVDSQILTTQILQKEHNQIIIIKVSQTEIAVWQEERFYEIIIFNIYSKKFYKFRYASIESFQLDESGQNEAEINLFTIFPGSTIGIQLNNKIIMVNYKSKKITRIYHLQVQKSNSQIHILSYQQQNPIRAHSQIATSFNHIQNIEPQQTSNLNMNNITPGSVINISSPSALQNNQPNNYHSFNNPFSSNILNIQPYSNAINNNMSTNSHYSPNRFIDQENQYSFNSQPDLITPVSQTEISANFNRAENTDSENEIDMGVADQIRSFDQDHEQEDVIEQFEDFKVVVNKRNNNLEKCAHFNSTPQKDCMICQKNLKIKSIPRYYLYMRSDQSIWQMNLHNGQINEWQQTDNSQVVQQRFFPVNENKWFYYKDTVDEQWIIVYNNQLQQGEYLSLKMMEFQSPILNKYWPLLNIDNQLQFFDFQKEQFNSRVFDPAGLVQKYSQNLKEMIRINFPEQTNIEEFDKIDNYSFVKTHGKNLVFILSEGDIYYIK